MPKKWLLKDLVEEYASWLSNPATGKAVRYHMRPVLALFGGWQPKSVGPAQVQEFLAAQKKAGLSDVTAYQRAKILRTILAWAVRMGKLPVSPLAMLRLPAPRSRRIEPPSREEVMRMYGHASPHVQRVLLIGLSCGPRIGPSELFSFFAVGGCRFWQRNYAHAQRGQGSARGQPCGAYSRGVVAVHGGVARTGWQQV